ncbi:MAG: efflux RND transporter periplasmic adaptor subunit [Proteobacteria bacterium]|nr:efflux RND transporter periplasmic adaptor subunit [Pseudomonadota bacterium]MDA1131705.1 efflux RND transporter periplasmic adaptor subunit [Pseudomonadota bacterium]
MRVSYIVALAIAAAVAAWIVSGQFGGDGGPDVSADAAMPEDAGPGPGIMTVRTTELTATERPRAVRVRGQTEVSRSTVVRSEIGGTINEILVAKGDRVTAGQILARVNLAERVARLAEIEALVKQREVEYSIARSLVEQGNRPMTALSAAETALESASAALQLLRLEINKGDIAAPFAGIIEDRTIQIGDVIGPGAPVALIVDEDPFLVAGNVSETDIASVKVGGDGTAEFLDGTIVSGTIRFVATVADPQTRTFRVELEVPNRERTLRAGLTSNMVLPVGLTLAHFVSPAALVMDEAGTLGVKAVNGDGMVEFMPTRVLASDGDGVWLDGLPEQVEIITVGQQFVRAGDVVQVVVDNGAN